MIRYANINELNMLNKFDKHINKGILQELIEQKRILVMYENNIFVGWLRYNLFWDDIPFMNMLYLLEEKRGKGYGYTILRESCYSGRRPKSSFCSVQGWQHYLRNSIRHRASCCRQLQSRMDNGRLQRKVRIRLIQLSGVLL